jgi:hypothetical protein
VFERALSAKFLSGPPIGDRLPNANQRAPLEAHPMLFFTRSFPAHA